MIETLDFATHALTLADTGFINQVETEAPPGLAEGFGTVLGWAKWIALAVCVLGLIIAGALMAIQSRRGEGGEHMSKIGMVLAGVIVISAATSLVSFLIDG
jgi:ABC-type Fe3+-siderophore transport system permease subunit